MLTLPEVVMCLKSYFQQGSSYKKNPNQQKNLHLQGVKSFSISFWWHQSFAPGFPWTLHHTHFCSPCGRFLQGNPPQRWQMTLKEGQATTTETANVKVTVLQFFSQEISRSLIFNPFEAPWPSSG